MTGSKSRPVFEYQLGWQDRVPELLRDRDQWVLWRYGWRRGKWTKIPYQAHKPSNEASSTDPQTWNPFNAAVKAFEKVRGTTRAFDGIGFVFAHGGGLVGFDLDGVILPDGAVDPWGLEHLTLLTPTYHEVSPSGRGIKGVALGELPGSGINKRGLGPDGKFGLELYDAGRFFTITGDILGDCTTVKDHSGAILELYGRYKSAPHESNGDTPHGPPVAGDDELIRLARGAKNGKKFAALFDEGAYTKGSQSEADLSLCCLLAFWFNRDAASIDRVFRRSALWRDKWDEERGETSYGAMTVTKAIAYVEDVYKPRKPADDDRPTIEVTTERYEVLGQTVTALARDPDVYSRGSSLVTVVAESEDSIRLTRNTILRQTRGTPAVLLLSESVIGCFLTRNAVFYQSRSDKHGEPLAINVHPPDWLISAVASRKHWPGIRPLLAVAEAPFPRPDGSIVEKPGYDPTTETFYRPAIEFPRVPRRPSRAEAGTAWSRLKALVEQFPFESDEDIAVWGAGLLTAIARPAIEGPVPGIAFVGNKAGTGKGLLVNSIGAIAIGRSIPTSTYPVDPVEASKAALAFARAAKQIVHFDNLESGSSYGNSTLDSVLTTTSVEGRPVHSPDTSGEIPSRTCWFLSGNNINPAKDAYRRWLPCNLVSPLERPEERRDIKVRDLLSHLLEHRGELVRDVLMILRAHAFSGWLGGDWAPLASFEAWDRVVRGALWFAGAGDCCTTRRKVADAAPERLARIALLEGWGELPGGDDGGTTSIKAVDMVVNNPDLYATLRNALFHFGQNGKLATSRSIGNVIRGMKGNLIDGMKFVDAGREHRAIKWAVFKVPSGESGESGECASQTTRESFRSDNYVNTYGDNGKSYEDVCEAHSPDSPDSPDDDDRTGVALRFLAGMLQCNRELSRPYLLEWAMKDGISESELLGAAEQLGVTKTLDGIDELWTLRKQS